MSDAPEIKDTMPLAEIAKAAQESRATYFNDPAQDQLLDIILELAEENCVLKDRLLTAAQTGSGDPDVIDGFILESDEVAARLENHSDFMNALFERIAKLVHK